MNRLFSVFTVLPVGSESSISSTIACVVSAHDAASLTNKRSNAWMKLIEKMLPSSLAYCFNSHSSFLSHQVADWPFFPLKVPHNEKSGPVLQLAIIEEGESSGNSLAEIDNKGFMSSLTEVEELVEMTEIVETAEVDTSSGVQTKIFSENINLNSSSNRLTTFLEKDSKSVLSKRRLLQAQGLKWVEGER